MNKIIIVLLIFFSTQAFGQIGENISKRYFDIDDEDRVSLFKQENIKKNRIDLSLYTKKIRFGASQNLLKKRILNN